MPSSEADHSEKCYTVEEAGEKLSGLDNPTLIKLRKIANTKAYGYNLDPEDLLQDVFYKVFDGSRKWRKDLDIFVFFRSTMKSVLYNMQRKHKAVISLHSKNDAGDELIDSIPDKDIDIARSMVLSQKRQEILSLFEDDPIARDLVEGRMENLSRRELLELTGLCEKDYDTKWKKVRRCINREFPGGRQDEE